MKALSRCVAGRHRPAIWYVVVLLVVAAEPASARQADDPFAPENKAPDKPATAKALDKSPPEPSKSLGVQQNTTPTDNRIEFHVWALPAEVRQGETFKLAIKGKLPRGMHTYPLTQRADNPMQDPAQLSRLRYAKNSAFVPLWPISETAPEQVSIPDLGTFLEHTKEFTWTQDVFVAPAASPGSNAFTFTINLQVCDSSCVIGDPTFSVPIVISAASPAPVPAALQDRLKEKPPPLRVVRTTGRSASSSGDTLAAPVGPSSPAKESPKTPTVQSGDQGLIAFLINGMLWGAISLLTPCVFPMIPITVSFFLKQSEQANHHALTLASVYSSTIVVVLTIGGVLLIPILQPFSQHWATNLVLGALFLVFAFSLLGMFEIRLPTALANFTSTQEGRGGLVGTMFMALTFTIISFTCVAPFYGGFIALAAAATSAADWARLTLGAFAFSATFASPFFLLALFPSLLRSLPKSGSWMNTIKVVMGFLEIAAALKFLRAGQLALGLKTDLLSYDVVLGLYVALALLCGLYLMNLYRLPHDHEPVEQLGVPRLMLSLAFMGLAFYLLPGLFKTAGGEQQRPSGAVFSWLDSFLLPDADSRELPWTGNLAKGLEEAESNSKLVFIDFTGKL
jgi:thiol:disulfide interchange protein DsbD